MTLFEVVLTSTFTAMVGVLAGSLHASTRSRGVEKLDERQATIGYDIDQTFNTLMNFKSSITKTPEDLEDNAQMAVVRGEVNMLLIEQIMNATLVADN